jgi:hypothetical protein
VTRKKTCSGRERRGESRLLCSDLVRVSWLDGPSRGRTEFAVLENVSASGASVLSGVPVAGGVRLRIVAPGSGFTGITRHCNRVGNGYLVGIVFDPGCRWSENAYIPEHLLDPSALEEQEF